MQRQEIELIDSQLEALWPRQWGDATDGQKKLWRKAVERFPHQAVENALNDLYRQRPDRLPSLEAAQRVIFTKLPEPQRRDIEDEVVCFCWRCMMRRSDGRYRNMSDGELEREYRHGREQKARKAYMGNFPDSAEARLEIDIRQRCLHTSKDTDGVPFSELLDGAEDDDPLKRLVRGGGSATLMQSVDDEAPQRSWKDTAQMLAEMAGGEA